MPPRVLTHLRHIDLAVPDFDAQRRFFTELWGLIEVHSDTGLSFLATEGSPEQYVVRLRRAADKRVDLMAFGAETPAEVDAFAVRLGSAGVRLISEPADLRTPGGGYGFRFFDNEGRVIEVSADVQVRAHRPIEEGESIPVRLSHVAFNSTNPEETVAFYTQHLGFAVSDQLTHPDMGDLMWFLRCNEVHHNIAFARCGHAALHHASFELRGLDEYFRGSGRMIRAGAEPIWGPGRHLAGNNTFTYFLDPHGNTVEYTTELERLDEDVWHPHVYSIADPITQDQWGIAAPMSEAIASKSFNDPDKGLHVAPPV